MHVLSADTLLCHIRIPRHWQQQARSLPRAASSARSRSSHTQALQARRLPSKPPAPHSTLSLSSSHCSNSAGPAQSTLITGRHVLALSIHSWVTAPSAALRSQHRHLLLPLHTQKSAQGNSRPSAASRWPIKAVLCSERGKLGSCCCSSDRSHIFTHCGSPNHSGPCMAASRASCSGCSFLLQALPKMSPKLVNFTSAGAARSGKRGQLLLHRAGVPCRRPKAQAARTAGPL